MKKILIAVCLLILFSWQNNALDLMPYWSLGDVKVGGVFKRTDPKADYNFSISAFKFYFYDADTGLNFSLNPFYIDIKGIGNKENKRDKWNLTGGSYILSLLNTELAFNTLYSVSDKFAVNLFTSFHIIDPAVISRFQLNAGLEFAIPSELEIFRGRKYPLKSKLLSVRSGFRYTENKPLFFLDIGIDLGSALFIFKPNYKKEAEKRKNSPGRIL